MNNQNKQIKQIYNVNVAAKTVLPTPAEVEAELPMTDAAEATVVHSRAIMENILDGHHPWRPLRFDFRGVCCV